MARLVESGSMANTRQKRKARDGSGVEPSSRTYVGVATVVVIIMVALGVGLARTLGR